MIEPLNIVLQTGSEEKYKEDHNDFLKSRMDAYEESRDLAELKWEERYPLGYDSWKYTSGGHTLNTKGQMLLIDKLNEVIAHINRQEEHEDGRRKD